MQLNVQEQCRQALRPDRWGPGHRSATPARVPGADDCPIALRSVTNSGSKAPVAGGVSRNSTSLSALASSFWQRPFSPSRAEWCGDPLWGFGHLGVLRVGVVAGGSG